MSLIARILFVLLFFNLPAAFAETKILVVGDSHTVGDFGDGLVSALRIQSDFKVALEASCGSSPTHWLGTPYRNTICSSSLSYDGKSLEKRLQPGAHPMPSLSSLIYKKKPDVVLLALGGNQMPKDPNASLDRARTDVARLILGAKAGGARCIWISPPSRLESIYPKVIQDRFTKMLEEVTRENGCRFVNSRKYTDAKDTVNDRNARIHYYRYPKDGPEKGRNPGRDWGVSLASEVVTSIRETGETVSPAGTSVRIGN